MKKLALIFSIVLFSNLVYSGTERFNSRLTGDMISSGTTVFSIEEDKGCSGPWICQAARDRVTLGVDNADLNYYSSYYLSFDIVIYVVDANSIITPVLKTLEIKYNSADEYTDKVTCLFSNAYKLYISIVNVRDLSDPLHPVIPLSSVPKNLYLEAEIEIDRTYQFNNTVTLTGIDRAVNPTTDNLAFFWNHSTGAEEYELEWAYYDNYNRVASDIDYDFRFNNSRVTISDNYYEIPLTYDQGYIVYRVRGVGYDPTTGRKTYGLWNVSDQGFISGLNPAQFFTVTTEHEDGKNWQYSAEFAEDGKRKDVVVYADGTYRSRQTVTRENTRQIAIVGSTIYDYAGRQAIQTLPTPVNASSIQYYNDIYGISSSVPYQGDQFDYFNGGCNSYLNPPMTAGTLSGYYYPSTSTNRTDGVVASAEGYPFTRTIYTSDNTGRIKSQAGPGLAHTLNNGHEVINRYSQPTELQIDRLFGSEAGDKSHFKRNSVVDQNGQMSVSYLDMHGRVVATSLTGEADNLIPLTETPVFDGPFQEDLFAEDINGVSQTNQVQGNSIVFTTTLEITGPEDVTVNVPFQYTLEIPNYEDQCLPAGTCFDCVYDLKIEILDECQSPIHTITVPGTTIPDFVCSSPLTHIENFPLDLLPGVYTIYKILTLNTNALNDYVDYYTNPDTNNCYTSVLVDPVEVEDSTCVYTCAECKSYAVSNYGMTPQEAQEYCESLGLCNYESPCEASYNMMLSDVSPGSQYAQYDVDVFGNYSANAYPLSVLNVGSNNMLPAVTHRNWRLPWTDYEDDLGNLSLIPLTPEPGNPSGYSPDIINYPLSIIYDPVTGAPFVKPVNLANLEDFAVTYWQESWAKSLVQSHPEYCYYEYCSGYSTSSGSFTSEEFDEILMNSAGWDDFLSAINSAIAPTPPSTFINLIYNAFDLDPYKDHSVGGYPAPNVFTTAMNSKFHNYFGDNTANLSIFEMIAFMKYCGGIYGPVDQIVLCLEALPIAGYDHSDYSTHLSLICDIANPANPAYEDTWVTFRSLYMSLKQEQQQVHSDEFALHHCTGLCSSPYGGYNACIGIPASDFDFTPMFDFPIIGCPYVSPCQSCNWVRLSNNLFEFKQRRFISTSPSSLTGNGGNIQANTSTMGYNVYLATGLCPLAFELQNFLNTFASHGNLTAPSISLSSHPEFTYDLYEATFAPLLPPSTFTPLVYSSSYNSIVLTITISGGGYQKITTLRMVPGSPYSFSDIVALMQIQNIQFNTSLGAYEFNITAQVSYIPTGQTVPIVETVMLYGTTEYEVGNCTFEDVCAPGPLGLEVQSLLNSLTLPGCSLSFAIPGSSQTFDCQLFPEIATLVNCSGNFDVVAGTNTIDIVGTLPNVLTITFNTLPTGINGFNNIIPTSTMGQFFIDVSHTSGVTPVSGQAEFSDLTVDVSLGECAPPENLMCNSSEHQNLIDIKPFIEAVVTFFTSNPPGTPMPLSGVPEFTSNLYSSTGSGPVPLTMELVSHSQTQLVLEIFDNLDTAQCTFTFVNNYPSQTFLWSDLASIVNIYADETNLISGHAYDIILELSMGDFIRLHSCIPVKNCIGYCPPESPGLLTTSELEECSSPAAEAAYNNYMAIFCNGCPPGSPAYLTQGEFCYYHSCYGEYQDYMSDMEDFINLSLSAASLPTIHLNELTTSAFYFTLPEFCEYSSCAPGYITAINLFNDLSSGTTPDYPNLNLNVFENPNFEFTLDYFCEFVSSGGNLSACQSSYLGYLTLMDSYSEVVLIDPVTFCMFEANECLKYYIDYLVQHSPSQSPLLTIEEFCDFIPTVPCVPIVNPEPLPGPPYETDCGEFYTQVNESNANISNQYNMNLLETEFINAYTDKCLSALEDFRAEIDIKETHFTLYYFDQAGNLIRTIPPEGVVAVDDDPVILAAIDADQTYGTQTYYTSHNYVSSYEYNSLNQVVCQRIPDNDLADIVASQVSNNGIPAGLSITDIVMQGSGNGYIIANDGSNGFFYYTNDNGLSWNAQTSIGVENLLAVYMIDADNGFITGENGTVLQTTNGGQSWTKLAVFTSEDLTGVYFRDLSKGIVTGENGTHFMTQDGGLTWYPLSGIYADIAGVFFYSQDDGFGLTKSIGSSTLYEIADGGSIWTVVSPDQFYLSEMNDVQCLAPNHVYLAGKSGTVVKSLNGTSWQFVNNNRTDEFVDLQMIPGTTTGYVLTSNHEILKTTNGGTSWSLLSGSNYSGISYPSVATGYATTSASSDIHKTANGGASWTIIDVSLMLDVCQGIFFESDNSGWVIGNDGIDTKILWTIDGGTTWNSITVITGLQTITGFQVQTLGSEAKGLLMTPGSVYQFGIDLNNLTIGTSIAMSSNNCSASLSDNYFGIIISPGGASVCRVAFSNSWITTGTSLNTTSNVKAVSCVSMGTEAQVIAITEDGKSFKSKIQSGGNLLPWIEITDVILPPMNDIALNGDDGIMVGDAGKAFVTDDGGLSWKHLPSETSLNLNSVDVHSSSLSAIVSDDNGVFSYTPGSSSLAILSITPGFDYTDIDIFGSKAFVTANNGSIMSTPLPFNPTYIPLNLQSQNAVHFVPASPSVGIVAGNAGSVFRTTDDGVTYQNVTGINYQMLTATEMVNATLGYAVGYDGTVLQTNDGGQTWTAITLPVQCQGTDWISLSTTSSGQVLAGGSQGELLMYDNSTWTCTSLGVLSIVDVKISGTFAYALDNAGNFWRWTWLSSIPGTPLATNPDYKAFSVLGSQVVIVGDELIEYSTNNGTTLVPSIAFTPSIVYNDVNIIDPFNVYACGAGGTVNFSQDGGANWSDLSTQLGTSSNLSQMTFGPDNTIYMTTNSGGSPAVFQMTNQVDAFSSRFWYDRLGRIIVSQNTKQFNEPVPSYSYSIYDALNRIIEVGKISTSAVLADYHGQVSEADFQAFIQSGVKSEVTRTYYDRERFPVVLSTISGPVVFDQENLRSRISSVTYKENLIGDYLTDNTYNQATHYSYDIHGNVKALVQDIPEMAPLDQQYKLLEYDYDLISGNVNLVTYQNGQPDQYYLKYEYDADNRITNAYTSSDNVNWAQDAKYFYYKHGPLARTEIGHYKNQGVDYAYTIQGWLKTINTNSQVQASDIGQDGFWNNSNPDKYIPSDQLSYSLWYFEPKMQNPTPPFHNEIFSDYTPVNVNLSSVIPSIGIIADINTDSKNLYNGNISRTITLAQPLVNGSQAVFGHNYRYDQLNRIMSSNTFNSTQTLNGDPWEASSSQGWYNSSYTYSPNGNIETLTRTDDQGHQMDNLEYFYNTALSTRKNNRLEKLQEHESNNIGPDIPYNGSDWSYTYDELGNHTSDEMNGIEEITWNNIGKVKEVLRDPASTLPELEFRYDAMGNRIVKIVKPHDHVTSDEPEWSYTYYLRDAQGNILSVYEKTFATISPGHYMAKYVLVENDIYGSSRVGAFYPDKLIVTQEFTANLVDPGSLGHKVFANIVTQNLQLFTDDPELVTWIVGKKQYELNNHLGNVLVTVSDNRMPVDDGNGNIIGFNSEVINAQDYYAFGMQMPGRSVIATERYRFGFQGQEKINEMCGEANYIDFTFRGYNPRLGRFFAVDPLTRKYPQYTPYSFSGNKVIHAIELEGLEEQVLNNGETVYGPYSNETIDGFNNSYNQQPISSDVWSFNSYLNAESKVGNTLVNNIENMTENAPSSYNKSFTTSRTYDDANKYLDVEGYCYVCSMSRTNKAYNDLNGSNPLPLDKSSDAYKYSSSQILGLNQDYAGYGVGGALSAQGLATLIPESDIWAGKLKPGAQLQVWYDDDASSVKLKLSNGESVFGHSLIFMSYQMGDNGALIINYSDYHGKEGSFQQGTYSSIFGANLIDP